MTTNAERVLERAGVPFEVRTYEVDLEDLSAPAVARKIDMPPAQVFKTLVARGDSGPCLAVVPGDEEVDLKALARLAGAKRMALVPLAAVEPLTGYVRGGVTAIATRKPFPVYVDAKCLEWERVAVSAGARGAQLVLDPRDFVRVTGASVGAIAR